MALAGVVRAQDPLAAGQAEAATDAADPARMVLAAAATHAGNAALARDIALGALENAEAFADVRQTTYVALLKAGDMAALRAARKDLESARRDVARALDLAGEIAAHVLRVTNATAQVEALAASLTAATPEDRSRRDDVMGLIDPRLREAEKYARKARAAAEELKQKWLVPLAATPAPAR